MTDKQDDITMEPEARDDEILDQEETFGEESLEEAEWQGELPPEDDFHDHDDFEDDVSFDEEEEIEDLEELPEEEEVYEEEEQDEEARKKRGRNMFYGVIAVGLLAVGGFGYMQFAGDSTPQRTRPITSLLDIQEIKKAPALAAKKDQAEGALKPQEVDMVALYQDGKTGGEVELPLPGESEKLEVKQDKEEIIASDMMVSEPSITKLPAPTAALPKKEEIEKVEEVAVAPVEAAPIEEVKTEVVAQPAPVLPSPETEKRLAEVTAQLDDMKASLDKATQENAQLVSKMETLQGKLAEAAKPVPAPAPVVDVSPELKQRVEELETLLAAKEEELQKAKAAKTVKAKTVAKKPKKAKRKVVRKAKTKWVLRGATPNAAWISPSSHSKELRSVTIGDVVPGLGKVKKITQKGQKWQVIGTKGSIQ